MIRNVASMKTQALLKEQKRNDIKNDQDEIKTKNRNVVDRLKKEISGQAYQIDLRATAIKMAEELKQPDF